MKITFKNLVLGLKDQLPLKRFFRNFLLTRNAWGLFHKNSHITSSTGKFKVKYNTKKSSVRAATSMHEKYGHKYASYKCVFCDGYHVGKNKGKHDETKTQ